MSHFLHLVRRFFSSLSRDGASTEDRAWARTLMTPAECELWEAMSPRDRRHSANTGRRVEEAMGCTDQLVLAAALLHDVGKSQSRLGVPGRVIVSLLDPLVTDKTARRISQRRGIIGEFGKLFCYTYLGEELLVDIGSSDFISSWAREHHEPEGEWTVVSAELGRILQSADAAS